MTNVPNPIQALLGDMAPKDPQLLEQLGETMMRGVIIESMSRMDEKTLDAFDALLDENADANTLATFLKEHVSDIESIVKAEASRLIGHYRELATA